jgi:hypothetical protein
MRPLREGEVMGAYMEFDRKADKSWTPAEYLVWFGLYVSERTVAANSNTNEVTTQRPPAIEQ